MNASVLSITADQGSWSRWIGFAGLTALLAAGCSEDTPTQTPPETGAGIRLELPEALRGAEWVRIELWHDNLELPPHCDDDALPVAPGRTASNLSAPSQDICGRWSVRIWDYSTELVRSEPDLAFGGGTWGWDTLDDFGDPVLAGMYFTHQECLDSQGSLTFDGSYHVWTPEVRSRCQWPLWVRRVAPVPDQRSIAFEGFPARAATLKLNRGAPTDTVWFANPYTIRVHGPGLETFESTLSLEEGRFSTVTVEAVAAAPEKSGAGQGVSNP